MNALDSKRADHHTARVLLSAENVRASYGERVAVDGATLAVAAGERWAILGPNGAGKSTLVKALLGLHPSAAGRIEVLGRPLAAWARKELAREVAWVPQTFEDAGGFTVLEVTSMGRAPHLGLWGVPTGVDVERARHVLDELGIGGLASRSSAELSGGERRMVVLARALVQAPKLLLLDEPTAFLDLRHQVELLQKLRTRAAAGLGVVAVLHDVGLAAAFADKILLMKGGRVLGAGPADEVLQASHLEELFDVPMNVATAADGQRLFAPRLPVG